MADKKGRTTWDKHETPYGVLHLPLDARLDKVKKYDDEQWERGRKTFFDPITQFDYVQNRPEDDNASDTYAKGGAVLNSRSYAKKRVR